MKQIGMSCSQRNVSPAVSPWRPATGGSRRSTITTTVSASTARCAKRTSKDRVSSPKEVGLSVRLTPASPPQLMYNSDTVYSTTTFRPVSPSPITPPAPETPSPQRTRKLETPLHFDGGLFSDIRSADGKLLSKVTVDRLHSSTRHDVTDSPSVYESIGPHGNKDYVNDVLKTETITNEDVIKVKFTPVPPEIDSPRLLTPSQFHATRTKSPIQYLKDNFEDLQSYKMVSSVCKGKQFESNTLMKKEKSFDNLAASEPIIRSPSPLANLLVPEQLTKIDSYLQESLDACVGNVRVNKSPVRKQPEGGSALESVGKQVIESNNHIQISTTTTCNSYLTAENLNSQNIEYKKSHISEPPLLVANSMKTSDLFENKTKPNSVKVEQPGVFRAIYNMPIHYHAAILCVILIVYNLVYQYIKTNCHGKK